MLWYVLGLSALWVAGAAALAGDVGSDLADDIKGFALERQRQAPHYAEKPTYWVVYAAGTIAVGGMVMLVMVALPAAHLYGYLAQRFFEWRRNRSRMSVPNYANNQHNGGDE